MWNPHIIIQARTGSRRFPQKVLKKIGQKELIWHVINRVKYVKQIKIILATTTKKEDDVLEKIANQTKIEVFRGSPTNVLKRFYYCAKLFHVDPIIRITGDCPLIDPKIIQNMLECFQKKKVDYLTNNMPPTFPDGLDVEIFSFKSLEDAYKRSKFNYEKEHVTPFLRKNKKYKKLNFKNRKNLEDYRWTVDEENDLKFIKKVYSLMDSTKLFVMNDILKLLDERPELRIINRGIIRNDGYLHSLRKESKL